jgi:hypothetical protein
VGGHSGAALSAAAGAPRGRSPARPTPVSITSCLWVLSLRKRHVGKHGRLVVLRHEVAPSNVMVQFLLLQAVIRVVPGVLQGSQHL